MPITLKLNFTNILIIVIPMLMLAFVANRVSTGIIIDKSVKTTVQGLNVVAASIDSVLNQTEYLSKLAVNNYDVQQMLRVSEGDIARYPEVRLDVIGSLDNIVGDQDIISSALVFNNKGLVLSSSKVGTYKLSVNDNEFKAILQAAVQGKGKVLWRSTHAVNYYLGKENVNCISMFRALINSNTGETEGALEIDVDQKIISQLFTSSNHYNLGEILIINQSGEIVSSSNEDKLYKKINNENYFSWVVKNNNGGKLFTVGKDRYLITSVKYGRLGWYVLSLTPLENLAGETKTVTTLIFLVGLVCISLAVMTSIFNSKAITKPLVSLSNDMFHAGQGDMEVRSLVQGNDEVGNLSKNFNNMMERVSDLMDKVYLEQKRKREFELMALQSQINPHFLYNTLENVCSLANKNRNDDVVSMVKSLAMFYRSALSKGRNVINIREEAENIGHYLAIQKIRYGEKFDYRIDMDETILNKPIVKLSLQPIVENSIYHGIRQKHEKGMIWILGKDEGNRIRISIIDDGVGFDEEKCKEIFSEVEKDKDRKSYGMKNVNDRLRLYFGQEYGINVFSSPGKGTRVEVILPSAVYDA